MQQHVHFIGIGGIGMSALARWFKAQGARVSGSDAETDNIIIKNLKREGIKIFQNHRAKNIPLGVSVIIRSQAIESENPELRTAAKRRIPTLSYPEALGFLSQEYKTIAIAGAHGKSTTTALTALSLIKGKLDPTVIVGTILKEFQNSNFRKGTGPLLVLEADEYGKAFLYYSPAVAIITNIDREHLDIYPKLQDVKESFLLFISHITRGGTLVANRDDKNLFSLKSRIQKIAKNNQLKVFWYSIQDKEAKQVKKSLSISGTHNLSNALAAFTVATKIFSVSKKTALAAIHSYKGAWRRMEYRGSSKLRALSFKKESKELKAKTLKLKARIFDDYAHHPTEIKATLQAFREKFPDSPLVCVFQPHQALRLQKLFPEFVTAFESANALVLLPTYQVRGRDKIDPRFTSETLAAAIQKKYPNKPVVYLSNYKDLKAALNSLIPSLKDKTLNLKPTLIMMGAGDIVRLTDTLL